MPETTPLIKAALNLRVGAEFDVYPTSAYGTAYSYTQPGLLVFESFPKRRTPGVCGGMSKMFVGGC